MQPPFPPVPLEFELRSADRLARLGRALKMLSHELAASRREVAQLRRENAALRGRLQHAGMDRR